MVKPFQRNRFTKILVFEKEKIVYNDQIETSFLAQPTGERVQQDARRIISISHTYIKKERNGKSSGVGIEIT